MSKKGPITIVLADDHRILREGLRALLENRPDLEVVGEAADGRAAVQLAAKLVPDIVIMDVVMPVLNGVEATRQIVAAVPSTRVLALSVHTDRRHVARVLKAGGAGYILKSNAFDRLVEAIRVVVAGGIFLCEEVADSVIRDYISRLSEERPPEPALLTPREREVLQLLAEGKSVRVIAGILSVSGKTGNP